MKKWRRRLMAFAVLGVVVLAAIYFFKGMPLDVAKALREAEAFELLSLDPEHGRKDADFHGYKVLGRTTITDSATRQRLTDELQSAGRWGFSFPPKCFDPRHAIRVTSKGHTYDLLICFECLQVFVYDGENQQATFWINRVPEPLFDQVLRDAGLPLAPKAPWHRD